ncbi:multidrug DMT transporter [Streptococcus bovimastitidis]|uniref:Multidrug DMT transporter n=1 Tax=Streptococcus bovimastitidis TaxID=1856638 RepID=A0A1L8MLN6_9STRE|nr:DMT family transporter [Streptococcus bovimastitidis]OJF71595.1 multidrug DMT transporter [Streptococcus bovimastitidis]
MSKKWSGSIMVLSAATAWGISGVSGQYLMSHGIHVDLLTSLRLLLSGLFLCGLALVTQKEHFKVIIKQPKLLLAILFFAIFGLLMNQYAYLNAVQYTNAGTATVLQFLSPIFILLYVSLAEKRKPSVTECVAMVLAILGTLVIATHGNLSQLAITPKGLFWGLLSAVTAALYIIIPARLIEKWGSLVIIGLGMLFAGSFFPFVTLAWQHPLPLEGHNILALFGLIGVGTIFAYTIFLKGTALVGPVNGSLLSSVEPVASVAFAILLLKEVFYPIDLLGMTLILASVLLISYRDWIIMHNVKRIDEGDKLSI